MELKVSDTWGEEILSLVKSRAETRHIQEQFDRWSAAKEGEIRAIDDAARAADRAPLADEQRKLNAITRDIGVLSMAVAGRIAQEKQARENRERIGGGGSNHTAAGLFGLEFKALVEGSGSGAYAVPDTYAGFFFDKLSAESVALKSGLRVISTTSDTLRLPTVTADPSAAWTAEAGTITATDPTYVETVATPRKLAALVQASNELILDSNPSVLSMLELQLARSLALTLDLGVFEGSGTAPTIRGLKNVSGIGSVSMGTNGAAFTNLDPFADAIGTLEAANARASAIVMHPRSWKALIKLKEQTTGNNKPLLQESAGSGGAGIERRLYGIPVLLSSQLSTTETQGTSGAVASSAYVYQADQVVMVRRSDVRVEVDRSRLFNSDQSEIRAIGRFDLVVPNAAAVCRIVGIL